MTVAALLPELRPPTVEEVTALAATMHMTLSAEEAPAYARLVAAHLANVAQIASLPQALPFDDVARYPREPAVLPATGDNPHRAWAAKGLIKGQATGLLAGKRVAIKDNVCIAGWPLLNGTAYLEGYTPELDATLVTRILDAGGDIVGKAVCEMLCFSGASHTSASGAVTNPADAAFSAGGSSSGCAALVACGAVDFAVGGDQGGSVRIPASWCGIVGIKPTHGLVPYSGVFPIEATIDHCGPMARAVADAALLLEAIAGDGGDGFDPRQCSAPSRESLKPGCYTTAVSRGVSGLRIGVLTEGFGQPGAQREVEDAVRAAARVLADSGAVVADVSVPLHRLGPAIWSGFALEGSTVQMLHGHGMGHNWAGLYIPSLVEAHGVGWRAHADAFSPPLKGCALAGELLRTTTRGTYHAHAQNARRLLTAAYDAALRSVDVLLLPSTPMVATRVPVHDAPVDESAARALEMCSNLNPFDVSGHPSVSVPCGTVAGLPIGLQLVGRKWDEATLVAAAAAYERAAGDWRAL